MLANWAGWHNMRILAIVFSLIPSGMPADMTEFIFFWENSAKSL
jgi:hypothetical protein